MRTIKTYCKGAPFYNTFHRTWPPEIFPFGSVLRVMLASKAKGSQRDHHSARPVDSADHIAMMPAYRNVWSAGRSSLGAPKMQHYVTSGVLEGVRKWLLCHAVKSEKGNRTILLQACGMFVVAHFESRGGGVARRAERAILVSYSDRWSCDSVRLGWASACASSQYGLGEKAPSEKVFDQAVVDRVHLELQTVEVLVEPVVDDFIHRK